MSSENSLKRLPASFSSSLVVAGAVEGTHGRMGRSRVNGHQATENWVWGFQLRPEGGLSDPFSPASEHHAFPADSSLSLLLPLRLILQDATHLFSPPGSRLGFHTRLTSFLSPRAVVFF